MGAKTVAVFAAVCLEITSTRAFLLPNAGPWQCHERTARLLLSDARTRSVRFVSSRPSSCSSSVRMRLGHADIEGELNSSPDSGRATHDRVTELFADSLSDRPWEALFTALATSSTFRDKLWNKEPFLVEAGAAGTAGSSFVTRSFGMDDVAQYIGQYPHQYAAQGTLSPDGKGGWYMKKVGMANGQNAMMTFADVQDALTKGTVVLNSAGAYLSPLAAISLATLESFQMPVGLNVYITAPGMKVSAPPHTDKQDVFVLQTQGSKHWRVFAPPPPSNKKGTDAYARGKGPDQLSLDELQAPLIETNLKEGQMLYIPAGYPHTTDTLSEGQSGPSLHLTIGLDTHIWGLDYAFLREVALRRQKMKTLFQLTGVDRDATALDSALYFSLTEPLPLGFLSSSLLHTRPLPSPPRSRLAQGEADLQVIIESMTASLAAKIKAAEPQRFTESEVTQFTCFPGTKVQILTQCFTGRIDREARPLCCMPAGCVALQESGGNSAPHVLRWQAHTDACAQLAPKGAALHDTPRWCHAEYDSVEFGRFCCSCCFSSGSSCCCCGDFWRGRRWQRNGRWRRV